MEKSNLIYRVLSSVFFKNANVKAGKMMGKSVLILNLLKESIQKASEAGGPKALLDKIINKVTLIGRLIKAYIAGDYREVSKGTLLKMVASLIYFVSPIDLIPDFLYGLGLADDLALLSWVINSIEEDLTKFEEWEAKESFSFTKK
jgi:uncharacterized membrane protein YkvA (DUF1232 family)